MRRWHTRSATRSRRPTGAQTCSSAGADSWTTGRATWRARVGNRRTNRSVDPPSMIDHAGAKTSAIRVTVNRFRFMLSSPWSFFRKTPARSGPFYGGTSAWLSSCTWGWHWPPLRPQSTPPPAAPGSRIWDGGSIWSSAPSAAARAIRNSPRLSGGTPRASGSERRNLSRPLRLGWTALKVQLRFNTIGIHFASS